ncbi:MAG: sulfatase [Candidatus Hydrogenedentes bacterium]|nr:sulfatase [Candidatus Hydrogenedentota bacterium]
MHRDQSRREFLGRVGATAAAAWLGSSVWEAAAEARMNVLFIPVDDLRPELGCYGNTLVHSPNIDGLAASGTVFERAYCQQAICMSSRASLLSGYRPDVGEIYKNEALYKHIPDALTLNRHFLAHGYETMSIGKVYHHGSDDKIGWSQGAHDPKGAWAGRGYFTEEAKAVVQAYEEKYPEAPRGGMGPAFEAAEVPDNAYIDGLIADLAVESLGRLKDKPFFLASGFRKPHLPFTAPKKYWDLYDPAAFKLADNPFAPKGAPKESLTNWSELRGYHGMPARGDMPDDLARQLIHGYYACVSYVDAQIGRVLDALDRLGLRENTVVVLWGDHGWKLGEHGMWCKHTNFELDTHAPLIFRAPGIATGQRTAALTEFVDIYPTLCDLCGLEKPAHLQGSSALPVLQDPGRPWKRAAFSQYPWGRTMGYSMRTDTHRYTEWKEMRTREVVARELYDHRTDLAENENVVDAPENADLVKELAGMLAAGYEAARPKP